MAMHCQSPDSSPRSPAAGSGNLAPSDTSSCKGAVLHHWAMDREQQHTKTSPNSPRTWLFFIYFFSPFPYSKIPQIIHEQLIQLFQLHFDHHLCVSWWKVFFSFIPSCPYPHSKCTAPVTAGRATQMVLFVHSKEMSTSALHPMVVIEEASMSSVFHGHHLYMGFLLSLPPLSSVTFSLYARSSSFQTLFSLWL